MNINVHGLLFIDMRFMYILISFNEIGNKMTFNVYVLLFHVMLFSN